MKTLAVLLLLLNVAYVAFMQFGTGDADGTAPQTNAPVQQRFVEAKEQLILVSERPALPAAPIPAPVPSPAPIPTVAVAETPVESGVSPPTEPWCALVTGFPDQDAANAFLSAASALGGSGELQSEQVPVSSTWWVHLPPFPSQAAAAPVLAELQTKQIDSYYVRTGELAGAISLGVFRSSARASVAQQELNAKGYSPSTYEMVRRVTRFNASIRLEDTLLRQQAEWANLEAGLQGVELQEIACK